MNQILGQPNTAQTNILIKKNRLIIIEDKVVVAEREGGGREIDWDISIRRYKLLYRGWIKNKAILYSMGDYIQYPVIKHNTKEYEKEYKKYIYLCIYIYIYTHNRVSFL